MRAVVAILALTLAGCDPGIEPDFSQGSREDQEKKASLGVIGIIERQFFESQPYFRIPGDDSRCWKVLRREVRIETVIKGGESRKVIPVHEVYQSCGATGNWNLTFPGERYLFMLRTENGRYRVVGDWWRSIYGVYSGSHTRLPLDERTPFQERVALLMWWVRPDVSPGFGYTSPSLVLGLWRGVKLQRGLLRHPKRQLHLAACEGLLHLRYGQDECWDTLSDEERKLLNRARNLVPVMEAWEANRRWEERASGDWNDQLRRVRRAPDEALEMDRLRLFTTAANQQLREEFCRKFLREFPQETEHGCPATRERPATVVTADGDVPFPGLWPE